MRIFHLNADQFTELEALPDTLPASPALQRGLQQHTVDLELAARAADPQVAAGGRFIGQGFELGELVTVDVEDAHR